MVALVARYHRRARPSLNHADFERLPTQARVRVRYLAAILRLAYALDVERTCRVRQVTCSVQGSTMSLQLDRRQIALERWSIRDKSNLFREVFGLHVEVRPRDAL